MEHSLVWEDGDDRYMVDDIPFYDSAEDKHIPHYTSSPSEHEWLTEEDECSVTMGGSEGSGTKSEVDSSTKSNSVRRVEANSVEGKNNEAGKLCLGDTEEAFSLNFNRSGLSKMKKSQHTSKGKAKTGPGSTTNKKSQQTPKGKSKVSGKKQSVIQLFSSKEVQAEVSTRYKQFLLHNSHLILLGSYVHSTRIM